MKNMKIKVKLITSFIIVILLAVVIGLLGIFSISSTANETEILNTRASAAIVSARLGRNVNQQRAAYRGASTFYLLGNQEKTQSSLDEMLTLSSDFEAMLTNLDSLLVSDDTRSRLADIPPAYAEYVAARDNFAAVLNNPDLPNEELVNALNMLTGPVDHVMDVVTILTDYIEQITDEQAISARNSATTTTVVLIVVLVVAAVIAVALSLYIASIIAGPINTMKSIMVQAGETGNLDFPDDVRGEVLKQAEYKDEIGQSLKAFSGFINRLVYIGKTLQQVAAKDLTVDVTLLSENDTMGGALREMTDNLNQMFNEINSVAGQVATASGEIATGAQSLAQGSTEQASTVEEISASVNEINEQMTTSSDTASAAAQDSQEISRVAMDGSGKMNQLTQAVQEINDASGSIGQVIKVIDDIAFQTNILALNAAVEAARAGEHGKGFAVVADEVRNLAGKSADAAKKTAALISTNIEKAEVGLTISQETAETLNQIVEGVQGTSDRLQEVAAQGQQAKAATAQVTLAVDQVAQVVQQNSATSEESAAASQEMSSQAQVLQQLIGEFKLKNMQGSTGPRPQLPAFDAPPAEYQDNANVLF